MKNRELKIATATTRTSSHWTNQLTTLQDLTARAYEPTTVNCTKDQYRNLTKAEKDKHKDVGGFVGGHLKHGRRRKGHILTRSLITLDLDNIPTDVDLPAALADTVPYAWLAHTTLSHLDTNQRWRIWVWLTRDVTADEYGAVARRVAQDINPGLKWFDPTTFEPERFFYWPATLTDGDYHVYVSSKKEILNPDEYLDRYDTWQDVTTWPGITPEQAKAFQATGKLDDPREKPGMLGAFNRVYPIPNAIKTFLGDVYKPGTTKDRYTYTGGTSSNGLIIYNQGHYAYSQHATDPAADGHSHAAFDLVRIHKYGDLDADTEAGTPANKKPSYTAMMDFINQDAATRAENAKATAARINDVFQPVTEGQAARGEEDDAAPSEEGEGATAAGENTNDPTAWLTQLETKKDGTFKDTIGNLELILTHDPHINHIAWNSHANHLEVQDPQALPWQQINPGWTDNDEAQLKTHIARTYGGLYAPTKMNDALLSTATKRAFHPVRDYFNHLPPWDGTPRLDTLLIDTLGADNTDYVRAVTRKTFVAAHRRTFQPGCKFDQVLTLVGPQGAGKSTIFNRMADPWFSDSLTITDMKDKTAAEKLAGNLIVELSELAGMRKAEAEPVKGFISRTEDKYRPAYGRNVQSFPRQGIIVGSTNADEGFLRDTTGNRRWWPVHVTGQGWLGKPHTLTQQTIDQLWAEARARDKQGEKLYLTGDLLQAAEHIQAESVEADDRVGIVAEYLDKTLPGNWDALPLGMRRIWLDGETLPDHYRVGGLADQYYQRTSVSKIEIWAECFGRDPDTMRKIDSHEITAIMRQIDDWEDSGIQRRLPIYGKQRVFQRAETRTNVLSGK